MGGWWKISYSVSPMRKKPSDCFLGDLFVGFLLLVTQSQADTFMSREEELLRPTVVGLMSWVDIEEINKHLRKRKATQDFDTKKQMDLTS